MNSLVRLHKVNEQQTPTLASRLWQQQGILGVNSIDLHNGVPFHHLQGYANSKEFERGTPIMVSQPNDNQRVMQVSIQQSPFTNTLNENYTFNEHRQNYQKILEKNRTVPKNWKSFHDF